MPKARAFIIMNGGGPHWTIQDPIESRIVSNPTGACSTAKNQTGQYKAYTGLCRTHRDNTRLELNIKDHKKQKAPSGPI